MATIKIEDLSVLEDLNEKQTKGIFGGYTYDLNTFDSQLDVLAFQQADNKAASTVQTMSSISKLIDDSIMGEIRNIG